MNKYYISIDLDCAEIEAETEEEALKKANQLIQGGCYSLYICDREEGEDKIKKQIFNEVMGGEE